MVCQNHCASTIFSLQAIVPVDRALNASNLTPCLHLPWFSLILFLGHLSLFSPPPPPFPIFLLLLLLPPSLPPLPVHRFLLLQFLFLFSFFFLSFLISFFLSYFLSFFLSFFHFLGGLVVTASTSRAEGPGFESRLRRDFFGVESYQ